MNMQTSLLLFLLIIVAGVLALIFLAADFAEEKDSISNSCVDYGCSDIAIYVGLKDAGEYYICSCESIPEVEEENVECFISSSQAEENGYSRARC
jgi:methylphosphotriester-DNA--protein-cysteine methyltransferase